MSFKISVQTNDLWTFNKESCYINFNSGQFRFVIGKIYFIIYQLFLFFYDKFFILFCSCNTL